MLAWACERKKMKRNNYYRKMILLRWMAIASLVSFAAFWISCLLPYNRVALLSTHREVIAARPCRDIIVAAEEHAAAKISGRTAIVDGNNNDGWQTERHKSYPTTDFALRSIPSATALWNTKLRDKVLPLVAAQVSKRRMKTTKKDSLVIVNYLSCFTYSLLYFFSHTTAQIIVRCYD